MRKIPDHGNMGYDENERINNGPFTELTALKIGISTHQIHSRIYANLILDDLRGKISPRGEIFSK